MTKYESVLIAEDIVGNVHALLATIGKLTEENERLKGEIIKLMDKERVSNEQRRDA